MTALGYPNTTFPILIHTPRTAGAVRRQKEIRLELTGLERPKERGESKSHTSDGPAEGNSVRTLLTKATALLEQFCGASANADWETQSRTGRNVKVQAGRGTLFMSDHPSSRVGLESAMGSEASSQKTQTERV